MTAPSIPIIKRWCALLWLVGWLLMVPAYAQSSMQPADPIAPQSVMTPSDADAQLDAILLGGDYSRTLERHEWRKKDRDSHAEPNLGWLERFFDWLAKHWMDEHDSAGQSVGLFVKMVAILLLLVLLFWLFRHYELFGRFGAHFVRRTAPKSTRHSVQDPIDMHAGLPELLHLTAYVKTLIDQGQYVLALSVLYRGVLRQLALSHELAVTPAQTEEQCQALLITAERLHSGEMAFFDQLVGIWQAAAYGDQLPIDVKLTLTKLNDSFGRIYIQPSVRVNDD